MKIKEVQIKRTLIGVLVEGGPGNGLYADNWIGEDEEITLGDENEVCQVFQLSLVEVEVQS